MNYIKETVYSIDIGKTKPQYSGQVFYANPVHYYFFSRRDWLEVILMDLSNKTIEELFLKQILELTAKTYVGA